MDTSQGTSESWQLGLSWRPAMKGGQQQGEGEKECMDVECNGSGHEGSEAIDLWGGGQLQKAALLSGQLPKKSSCPSHQCPEPALGPLTHFSGFPVRAPHLCQVIFGGRGPFYSDYAVLQLRLLNFSPFWSLIFTIHGTITLLHMAQPGSWPRGLLAAPGKIKGEINILEVKTVLKGQTLSGYKSVQQDSVQKSLCLFSIWPEKNSNNKTAATRWTRMIRSSPPSLRAGTSGYTECFVLWSVKP